MPFGGMLSLGVGALGAGSSLYSMFNGTPTQNVNVPTPYQFQNQGGADQNAYAGIGGLNAYNTYGQFLPQAQQFAQNAANNPFAGGYQQGAGTAGQMGMGAGMNAYGTGGALQGQGMQALPDVSALLNMGFDPQNALYAKLQQQNQDQTNAQNSMSGVASTPYGAGLAAQSNQNFNLGWQNNQLARATQGAQGAGNLLNQAGGAFGQGAALQGGGANTFLQGAQQPYNAYSAINQNALGALGQGGQFGQQASMLPQQQVGDYLQYLGAGTAQNNAGTSAANAQINQGNSVFNQQQQLGNNLGNSLSMMGRGFGGNSGASNTFWPGSTMSGGGSWNLGI